MAGHSTLRHDIWTDAGREQGDMFLICIRVSPTQAYAMQRWLELDGWTVDVRPSESTGTARRSIA